MHFHSIAVFSFLAAQVAAVPFSTRHVVHERREAVPEAWIKRDRIDGAAILPIRIGMTQSNLDKGHDLLMEVSTPGSAKYGKHYTAEEVTEIFAPSQATVDAVREWLVSAGFAAEQISQSVNKQWMQLDIPASDLESLIQTEYHVYEHSPTGKTTVACEQYHVPGHLQEHIDYITPGIKLFTHKRRPNPNFDIEKRTFGVTSGDGNGDLLPPLLKSLGMTLDALLAIPELQVCDIAVTPACIKALYNVTSGTTAASGNQLGIFEDLGDVYSQTDLNEFFLTFASNIPQGTGPKLEAIDGAVAPVSVLEAGPESDLDFQIAYPLIYPQNTILFQTDDPVYENNYTFTGFLNTLLDALDGSYCSTISPLDPPYPDPSTEAGAYKGQLQCGLYTPTNVISISYGGSEADLPAAYQTRQCNEFMKLGMQGVSIVVASGDSGVAGAAGDGGNSDGCLGTGQIFNPDFPATCPYLTTVGATTLPLGANVKTDSEVAVTRFGSGGGFSNIYPIPSYQSAAVAAYFNNDPPPYASYSGNNNTNIGANGGIYNNDGRGYPDLSAVGDNIIIFNMGLPTLIGGTSAAAPLVASLLTRINEERIAAGKSTVGFVNPTLYANPQVLHDITQGDNPGCNTNGFSASTGWDPVTGLGTPNYPAMLELFMSL
ncbi:subtilisin-like protein [Mollisia scopiformis]|uniref:tripeptidyl-peptidase II n=1 Tax=Mollisia scopiformis TaxID=149040 RepID=A0A194X8T2_MOLSC|nr:subtilisin-like protein [Mollisia scopiformis]KUJ16192.1 subtilisin-like protein [Mollisia scopiformis]